MWVLVVSGFAGTGLNSGGVEADPSGPIFLATTGRVVLIEWGVKPPNPRQIEHWLILGYQYKQNVPERIAFSGTFCSSGDTVGSYLYCL